MVRPVFGKIVRSPVLPDASSVPRFATDQGAERAVVYFVTGAVPGARRTPVRNKTGGVPPKPPATIPLSVTFAVLGLRFVLPQGVAASFWPAAAAALIRIFPDVAASLWPAVAAAVVCDGEDVAASLVLAVAAAAVSDLKNVAACWFLSVVARGLIRSSQSFEYRERLDE